MARVKEEDIIYSTDSAAPELLQVRSYSFFKFIEFQLPEESADAGSEKWWKRYWVVINDILSAWHKLPEIAFLAVNMLNMDPNERMTAKGVIDYLDGKCKPKYYEKTAEKIAMFGNVSVEELRKLTETEGFMEGFNAFLKGPEKEWKNEMEKKEANEKKHEEQIKKMEQKKKALKEKEEKEKTEKKEKEKKEEKKKTAKKKEEAIENLKEKALMKKKNIKEHLANALKSIAGLLEELKKRSAICED
ncbi:hypothetical protein niasHT_012577 [Heterodera trifolii]|uniref:Protein kinase domain-containing protein n=1 Tax=Heterodera trifolii TaxID=157864 RepID=A0ABD2L2K7_9BILA